MATTAEPEQSSEGIDYNAYNAALNPKVKIEDPKLKDALNGTTPGGKNTLLHLAAGVGNLQFVQQLLRLNPLFVKATNAQGNTALHLAAQGGFPLVVEHLLKHVENGVEVENELKETALFKACESGDSDTVRQLSKACSPSLWRRTVDERTCLYVAINRGDSVLADHILELSNAKDLIQEKYKQGDTILHIAVERNDVDIIRRLIRIEPQLCYSVNDKEETPLCVAVKLGHREAVQELIEGRPDAVEISARRGMNVLHFAAQVSQVRIVDYLNEKLGLLYLVNKGVEEPPKEKLLQSGENTDPAGETDPFSKISEGDESLQIAAKRPLQSGENTLPAEKKDTFSEISEGDTPLHIAARKKNFNMVKSLLRIRGINRFALNKEGLTALDIVKENTQYHESDKIISVLASYPSKRKPFLYSAPKVSAEKHEIAVKMVDKTYEDRRNTELVVAVLLATMSFTAAFTVPGGFVEGGEKGEGSPLLLGLDTFKLFLIFDCVAFFLSLFVVLMWQMSTPITTGDKVLFLCVTNLLVCATFAFTAYGFMLAVYAMLADRAHKLGWVVLGSCLFICSCANFTFFYMVAKFSVKKARFNYLNGLLPFLTDWVGEWVWKKLERWGLLDYVRRSISKWLAFFYWDCHEHMAKKDAVEEDTSQDEKEMATSNEGKAFSVIHNV
ncbi:hypothetical protein SUGI_0697030 [Cryptomeria japonica]|nr:hypothetical protein SUGI_0697030 [Cryptomeria japonica]